MVVGVKLRRRDLHSSTHHHSQAIALIALQLEFAQHQPRSNKVLHFTIIRSPVVEDRIALDLRPKELADVVLSHHIPYHRTAQLRGVAYRQDWAHRRLNVEPSKTLARAQSGCNRCGKAAVLVASGR